MWEARFAKSLTLMTMADIAMLYRFTDRRNLASIRELGGL
jgi:hypothetical protein